MSRSRNHCAQTPLILNRFMHLFSSTSSGAPAGQQEGWGWKPGPPVWGRLPLSALAATQSQPVHPRVSTCGGLGVHFPSRQESLVVSTWWTEQLRHSGRFRESALTWSSSQGLYGNGGSLHTLRCLMCICLQLYSLYWLYPNYTSYYTMGCINSLQVSST